MTTATGDALLLRVSPNGPAAITGSISCFAPWLWRRIRERARPCRKARTSPDSSPAGRPRPRRSSARRASRPPRGRVRGRRRVIEEMADLWFHSYVSLAARGLDPAAVEEEWPVAPGPPEVKSFPEAGASRSASREAEGTGPVKPRQPAPAARCQSRRAPARWMSSETKRRIPVPATALRCRVCETEVALEAVGVCPRCFAPLEPVYDKDKLARTATRERIAAGPPSLWRYAPLLPVDPPEDQRLAPGLTPLVRAPRLAERLGVRELWLKLDTANPTHSLRTESSRRLREAQSSPHSLACASTGTWPRCRGAGGGGLDAAASVSATSAGESSSTSCTANAIRGDGPYDDCSRLTVGSRSSSTGHS